MYCQFFLLHFANEGHSHPTKCAEVVDTIQLEKIPMIQLIVNYHRNHQ